MKKRGSSLASPAEIERLIRGLCQDALAIYPMYRRLHGLGLEGARGETVQVSGGSDHDPTGELVARAQQESRREYARWVAGEVFKAAKTLDRIRQGLERNVGPGPGFRQSESIGSDAIVSMDDFIESLQNQRVRLKAGME